MPLLRRRTSNGLPTVLGTPDLFSTAYGNVGSSIYYALGVTAIYALGLTPITFLISGAIFAFTACTYAEATARFPEAGGSASFARRAFNEVVSFFAAWAQMLNYTVTIAISAFSVPPYLSVFPGLGALHDGAPKLLFAIALCALLALLNIRGIQESARLNIVLALADLATQALLVLVGAVLILSPSVLIENVHWGEGPTLRNFLISIPIGMVAYTGIETISNMAEEARDPGRDVPRSIALVALAVFAIYAFLPAVALSALPVHEVPFENPTTGSQYTSQLATTYAADPVAGIVQNLGLGVLTTPMALYVGLLAATILLIATNAGIIGVSRLTYSMGVHRQFPRFISAVHPTYRTPWFAIMLFTVAAVVLMLPNQLVFLGNLYAFGAMLSFTVAHAAVIALRLRQPDPDQPFRAPFNVRVRGYDVPLFAVVGGLGTLGAFLVTSALFADVRYAGLTWMALGMTIYVLYRRNQGLPLTETVRAEPTITGPEVELEYNTVLLHLTEAAVADEMTATALRLAGERGARVVAVYPVVVPASLPMEEVDPDAERVARRQVDEAEALGAQYGVPVVGRIIRTRNAGRTLVEEAEARGSEIIVLGAPGRSPHATRLFGDTVDYVLRHARCKVMVGATPEWRGPRRTIPSRAAR